MDSDRSNYNDMLASYEKKNPGHSKQLKLSVASNNAVGVIQLITKQKKSSFPCLLAYLIAYIVAAQQFNKCRKTNTIGDNAIRGIDPVQTTYTPIEDMNNNDENQPIITCPSTIRPLNQLAELFSGEPASEFLKTDERTGDCQDGTILDHLKGNGKTHLGASTSSFIGQIGTQFDRLVRNLRNTGTVKSDLDVAHEFMWKMPESYAIQLARRILPTSI
ncbi:hypothetical protein ONE63_008165 [Megalurothrips usitatus]|uniref:Uncharacterized protein n=1 Tax=Megalurothrips usitatus TaxID=439358 RepID=A0AAV7XMU8_9NEOP|nr:hypothetical protein ONE63_008165 [Megalurothrips usitatus]